MSITSVMGTLRTQFHTEYFSEASINEGAKHRTY